MTERASSSSLSRAPRTAVPWIRCCGYDAPVAYRLVPDKRRRRRASRRTGRRQLGRRTVAVLPTLFTLGNLQCGFLAIFFASRSPATDLPWNWTPLTLGAGFIFFGMVLDALDGRVARLTRKSSELGEQLDSMADMITFGAAPAFLAVVLARIGVPFFSDAMDTYFGRTALVVAAIYVACASLRLARFNIEKGGAVTSDSVSFKGMPTPAAAGTVASFVLMHQHLVPQQVAAGSAEMMHASSQSCEHWSVSAAAIGMVAIMLLVAVGMVSRLPYPHVANRYFHGKAPFNSIVRIVLVAPFLVIWPHAVLVAGFAGYAVWAPATQWWGRGRRARGSERVPQAAPQKREAG